MIFNPNHSMILFLSLVTAGKTESDQGKVDGGFWLLWKDSWCSFDVAQCAGSPVFLGGQD